VGKCDEYRNFRRRVKDVRIGTASDRPMFYTPPASSEITGEET
jgi:hypothetical protein